MIIYMPDVKNVLLKVPWDLDERIARAAKQRKAFKRAFILKVLERGINDIEKETLPCSCKCQTGNAHEGEQ